MPPESDLGTTHESVTVLPFTLCVRVGIKGGCTSPSTTLRDSKCLYIYIYTHIVVFLLTLRITLCTTIYRCGQVSYKSAGELEWSLPTPWLRWSGPSQCRWSRRSLSPGAAERRPVRRPCRTSLCPVRSVRAPHFYSFSFETQKMLWGTEKACMTHSNGHEDDAVSNMSEETTESKDLSKTITLMATDPKIQPRQKRKS